MSTTNESIWNDIRRRGIGTDIKQEDDVNLLDVDGLYEYVKKHYTGKVFYIDKDNFGSKYEKVCVDPVKNVSLYTKYDNNNGELDHILISWISVHLDKDFIWKIYDRFQVEKTNPYRLCVWNQDGTCTNQTYIDLIDFFVENKDNIVVNESVWNDIRRRGIGADIKQEEITEDFLKSVNRCFVGFSMRIVYHLTEKEYEPILDDFCKYLEVDEKNEDPGTIKKIIAYVNSHQDESEKMLDKCMTFEKKLLEEKVICYIHRFVDDIVYCEKYHNTLSDIKRYASEQFKNDNSCEHFFPTKNMISKKKSELFDNYIEDNWPTGYLKEKIDELIKKENDEMSKYGFKKEPGKTIADTVNDWWDSLDDSKKDELAWDEFGEDAEEEYYTDHNPKYNEYDGEDFDGDEWWDDSYYIRRVHIYCQEHSKKNESVWNDIRRRGIGADIKQEDDIPPHLKKVLSRYIEMFAFRCYYQGDYTAESAPDFRAFVRDFANNPRIEELHPNISELINYFEHMDVWNNVVLPLILKAVEKVDNDEKILADKLWNEIHNTNESVWNDIRRRGIGTDKKMEDKVLTDDEYRLLDELAKMFYNTVKVCSNPKNPVSFHYDDTCDDFVHYITKRKEDHRITDGTGKPVDDKTYDKLIDFVKDNCGDCTSIKEFKDKYFDNLNECDGVPGGLTPADVGGMGAAYFPGPNGEPGSGDLPMPTGHVYHQVAPFGVFIKELKSKKKKKKKKFRKEDEPCSHSPNAKVYDYVDDYRDYVDRTYTIMNRKK